MIYGLSEFGILGLFQVVVAGGLIFGTLIGVWRRILKPLL